MGKRPWAPPPLSLGARLPDQSSSTAAPPPRAWWGSSPPHPHEKFSREDLLRIKTQGPRVRDLELRGTRSLEEAGELGLEGLRQTFIPRESFGRLPTPARPWWWLLPTLPRDAFLRELRRRNWTSRDFDPGAPPLRVDFYQRRRQVGLNPGWPGLRAVVREDSPGSRAFKVHLPQAGRRARLEEYLSAGDEAGALHRAGRGGGDVQTPDDGYEAALEQVFQAFEERVSEAAHAEFLNRGGWVRPQAMSYNCPGDDRLHVRWLADEPSFHLGADLVEPVLEWGAYLTAVAGVFASLVYMIFARARAAPTDLYSALEFAQSKGDARREGSTGVGFADVGGLDGLLGDLRTVLAYLRDPGACSRLNARPPRGILLEGPPGTGKTLVAKALAGEAGVPFYQMAGSEFVELVVGVGAARVRDLFRRARAAAPAVIFVDEIDAIGAARTHAARAANEEREQTLNQLLSEMDGFSPAAGVVVLAATNRADLLDAALLRRGRFDRRVSVPLPDERARRAVLRVHARRLSLAPALDLDQLARDLAGLSGAGLAAVLEAAVLRAAAQGRPQADQADVDAAVDRALAGVPRAGLPPGSPQLRALALSRAGAGAVAVLEAREAAARGERGLALERVSVVPRTLDWARCVLASLPEEDGVVVTRRRLVERIRLLLAGHAAGEVGWEDDDGRSTAEGLPWKRSGGCGSSQASDYDAGALEEARQVALRIVGLYGLSPAGILSCATLPPPPAAASRLRAAPDEVPAAVFAESWDAPQHLPTDHATHALHARAHALLLREYNAVLRRLWARRAGLRRAAEELLRRGTLLGKELEEALDAGGEASEQGAPQRTQYEALGTRLRQSLAELQGLDAGTASDGQLLRLDAVADGL